MILNGADVFTVADARERLAVAMIQGYINSIACGWIRLRGNKEELLGIRTKLWVNRTFSDI